MKKEKKYTCIACPLGCNLTMQIQADNRLVISGNKCKRGIEYAREEYLAPKRIVTATCPTDNNLYPRVPVKTDKPVLKKHINSLLKEIYQHKVSLPVKQNIVIIKNFKESGVNVVITRTITNNTKKS